MGFESWRAVARFQQERVNSRRAHHSQKPKVHEKLSSWLWVRRIGCRSGHGLDLAILFALRDAGAG